MKYDFNSGWDFKLTKINVHGMDEYKSKLSGKVDLPHDFSIHLPRTPDAPGGGAAGWYPGGRGEYTNTFVLDENEASGVILIEFEGVYNYSEVWVNDSLAAQNYYGYSGFYTDASPFVHAGENKVTVIADNTMQPNSRWYSGSGMYRKAWLFKLGRFYLKRDGIAVKTLSLNDDTAKISISAGTVNLDSTSSFDAHYTLTDPAGDIILNETAAVNADKNVTDFGFVITKKIANPMKWSDKTPNLYSLHLEIIKNGTVADAQDVSFGIRTVQTDSEQGLLINGEPVKLIGGCIHHDNGPLGACAYDSAEWAKVYSHKQRGFNALRTAHNPPSKALLDACDRLGLYVIDEAFDCFAAGKTNYDFHIMFAERWQNELSGMIKRDRNHPSVIIWSIGNEIPGIEGKSATPEYAEKLAGYCRTLDTTRPVISALHALGCTEAEHDAFLKEYYPGKSRSEIEKMPDYSQTWFRCSSYQKEWYRKTAKYRSSLDIDGLNYLDPIYKYAPEYSPHSYICGTETFAEQLGPRYDYMNKTPFVIGDFVWTSMDYIGESGIGKRWHKDSMSWEAPYPHYVSSCGDVDICGFPRTQAYYRAAVTKPDSIYITVKKPGTTGEPSFGLPWSFDDSMPDYTFNGLEGQDTFVYVYCDADEAELFVGDTSVGVTKVVDRTAKFRIKYTPGVLSASAYKNGTVIAQAKLRTASDVASLRLVRRETGCPNDDLTYTEIFALDKEGTAATDFNGIISASVSGGELVTVSSGKADTTESHGTSSFSAYRGSVLAIMKGHGILTVKSKDLIAEMKF